MKLLMILPFLVYVLIVNGAIPGFLTPTLGQAVWLAGFAKSLADAPTFSIFSHTLGLPEPAAIAFGLPGALIVAVGLKLGLTAPDSYAFACLFWLTVAFWGAYRVGRYFGSTALLGAFGATVWLTFPIVWVHSGYSMLSMGIALLPAYLFIGLVFLEKQRAVDGLIFLAFTILASFMDGYTFIMFASATLALIAYRAVILREVAVKSLAGYLFAVLSFGVSYYLYSLYSPSGDFTYPVDFFRGWGVDIAFLLRPTRGILLLPDLLGISEPRNPIHYFGDSSVHITTFAVVPAVLAVLLLLSPYGDTKLKLWLFGIGFIALYLALGPSFKFNSFRPEGLSRSMPAEYALGSTGTAVLWEKVPGLYSMRAVYRWMALALLGFWAVGMVAMADHRMPKWLIGTVIALLLAINFPQLKSLTDAYLGNRLAFERMGDDIDRELRPVFLPGDTVAFLPAGNDFLINYLAPKLGISTYNIGGDKNGTIARSHWSQELQEAASARTPEAFAFGVFDVLNGATDLVAVPYLNLLGAAHAWPYPRDRFEEMQPYVDALRGMGVFHILETEYFAVVRLNEEVGTLSAQERQSLIASMRCPVSAAPLPRATLHEKTPVVFSEDNQLCGTGWSAIEPWGRWTDGDQAQLHYDLAKPAVRQVLEFDLRSYVMGEPPRQTVGIRVNGQSVPDWVFTPETAQRITRLEIPEGATELTIEFTFSDARSPRQATGGTGDPRMLGIGVTAVCLSDAETPCLPD